MTRISRRRSTGRTRPVLFALLLVAAGSVLTVPPPLQWAEPAGATLHECTIVAPCSFEGSLVEWDENGVPGAFLNATVRVNNTGDADDSYSVEVTVDNDTWIVESDLDDDNTGTVAAGESTEFTVAVRVPEAALVDDSATISVNISSDTDDELDPEIVAFAATALQVYGWSFLCTDRLEVEKTQEGDVVLTAHNEGNGPDSANVTHTPLDSLHVPDIERFQLQAAATGVREFALGVGIGLEEGNYTLHWDLRSFGDPDLQVRCTTILDVVVGEVEEDDDNDSPAPAAALLLALLAAVVAWRRRERSA